MAGTTIGYRPTKKQIKSDMTPVKSRAAKQIDKISVQRDVDTQLDKLPLEDDLGKNGE